MKKYQIKKITGHQTSKVLAIVLGILSLIPSILMVLPFLVTEDVPGTGLVAIIMFPVIYFVMTYLITRLFSFIYNRVVDRIGGIELIIEEEM